VVVAGAGTATAVTVRLEEFVDMALGGGTLTDSK